MFSLLWAAAEILFPLFSLLKNKADIFSSRKAVPNIELLVTDFYQDMISLTQQFWSWKKFCRKYVFFRELYFLEIYKEIYNINISDLKKRGREYEKDLLTQRVLVSSAMSMICMHFVSLL